MYAIAYLAHRLGYATLAAQALGSHRPDARRFQALIPLYVMRLREALSHL